ncbi:acyltransferase [Pseudorhodoferax sp. Leaf274]|uniref:acyltransferase family protein n=1 Tax=Pseudorhodoferax sp. Leaf274 TaxID=1736318 RepID=UPI0012E0EC83|nr:acyltransferase [Pseudorhodoferax sp. Leaf274]
MTQKLDSLTSLRFFAAAMIVVHHAIERGLGPQWASHFALGQGVSFFFVLSGFVLAYNYPVLHGAKDIGRFLLARVARIWPAHIAATVLFIVFIGNISSHTLPQGSRAAITAAYVTLTHAWLPLGSYYSAYNAVSWSISTEFFFYLAFPLLISNWQTTWKIKMAGLAAVTMVMWWLSSRFAVGPQAEFMRGGFAYISPLARILEFALGIAVCHAYRDHGARVRAAIGRMGTVLELGTVVLIVFGLWASRLLAHHPAVLDLVGRTGSLVLEASGFGTLIYAVAIFVFALQTGRLSRILGTKPLVFLGEISFALYLVHTLFLLYLQQAPGIFMGLPADAIYAWYWICGLAGAALLHLCVEVPAQRLIRGWRDEARGGISRWRLMSAFCAVVLVLVVAQPTARWFSMEPAAPDRNKLAHPVVFDEAYRLDAIEVQGGTLRFSWTAAKSTALAKRVGVHLLDGSGNMLGQLDFVMDTGYRHAPVGQQWSNFASREGVDLRAIEMLGIAVYDHRGLSNTSATAPVRTDWNGQRLLVPLR